MKIRQSTVGRLKRGESGPSRTKRNQKILGEGTGFVYGRDPKTGGRQEGIKNTTQALLGGKRKELKQGEVGKGGKGKSPAQRGVSSGEKLGENARVQRVLTGGGGEQGKLKLKTACPNRKRTTNTNKTKKPNGLRKKKGKRWGGRGEKGGADPWVASKL